MIRPKSRENVVETELVRRVEALGGIAEKTVSPGGRGYFDRVVILPGGRVIFVECKRPQGGKVSAHQLIRHKRYRTLGVEVAVISTEADIETLLGLK
jgi:hypothetical protein